MGDSVFADPFYGTALSQAPQRLETPMPPLLASAIAVQVGRVTDGSLSPEECEGLVALIVAALREKAGWSIHPPKNGPHS